MSLVNINCPNCTNPIEIPLNRVSGEWFGTDADGNRGMWVSPYFEPGDIPKVCLHCKHPFTIAELEAIAEKAQDEANELDADDIEPEHDYDEER